MLRKQLNDALKKAKSKGDDRAKATLRLVMTALKERDHCARKAGSDDGLGDEEIKTLLEDMIKQRRKEITRCESKAQIDLAEQEAEEIAVLQQFMPKEMSTEQIHEAIDRVIKDLNAKKLKDTGKVMAALKKRFKGQMDFAIAKRHTCKRLS